MQSLEMIGQPKNRSMPPFIGIAGTNEMGGKRVIFQAKIGTVPLYTEEDIMRLFEVAIGFSFVIILRTEDGKKYQNLQEFYEDGNKKKLLKE